MRASSRLSSYVTVPLRLEVDSGMIVEKVFSV